MVKNENKKTKTKKKRYKMSHPKLFVEVGTLIYDKEFPEDVGMIVAKDEERQVYKIYSLELSHKIPAGWYKADYVQNGCLQINETSEYISVYKKRIKEMDEQESQHREFWSGLHERGWR